MRVCVRACVRAYLCEVDLSLTVLQNSVAKPLEKTTKAAVEETSSGSPKIDKKKSPYGLWIPV